MMEVEELKRKRGWGVLQLYPELQESQEFHPWKRSFLLSSVCLEKSANTLLYTDAVFSRVAVTLLYPPKSLPLPGYPSGPVATEIMSWRTRLAQLQHRGGRGHRIEEVASPGMHGSRHDQTCSVYFSYSPSIPLSLTASPLLFTFLRSVILFRLCSFPLSHLCPASSCLTERGHWVYN